MAWINPTVPAETRSSKEASAGRPPTSRLAMLYTSGMNSRIRSSRCCVVRVRGCSAEDDPTTAECMLIALAPGFASGVEQAGDNPTQIGGLQNRVAHCSVAEE